MAEENEQQGQKIGSGHLKAFIRQGAKELSQILPAFPGQGVHVVEEPGLVGNLTPQEVVQDKGAQQSYEQMLDGYASHSTPPQQQKEQGQER